MKLCCKCARQCSQRFVQFKKKYIFPMKQGTMLPFFPNSFWFFCQRKIVNVWLCSANLRKKEDTTETQRGSKLEKESEREVRQLLSDHKTWSFPIFLSNDPCYDLLPSLQLCSGLALLTVKGNSIYKASFTSFVLHIVSLEAKSTKPFPPPVAMLCFFPHYNKCLLPLVSSYRDETIWST